MIPALAFPLLLSSSSRDEKLDKGVGSGRERHRYLPIISALLCPFSVLLEIPGLTERWYVKTDGYRVIETQNNSAVLIVGLAISMALGVAANVALIGRYLEKRVYSMTLIAIACLTLHHVINITSLILFWRSHPAADGFERGQAYWLTMTSTIVSSICNVTLVIDFFATKNFAQNGSGLTDKQRSLVIACMVLMCYIALGSLVFSLLLELTYINSLYFTVCTISSVGFGDITPTTLVARLFSFPYDACGLILLAFCTIVARETIIEGFEKSYRYRRSLIAQKLHERKLAVRRRAEEKKEKKVRDALQVDSIKEKSIRSSRRNDMSSGGEEENTTNIPEEGGIILPPVHVDHHLKIQQTHLVEEQSFNKFKNDMAKEERKEFHSKLLVSSILFFLFWFIGAAVFHATEGWDYAESLYFCFIFFTTIGYGDYSPKTVAGRSFFVIWAILGIATLTLLLSVATEAWSSNYRSSISSSRHINHKKVQQRLSQHDLESHRPPLPHSSHHIVSRTRDAEDKIMDPRSFVHKYLEAARGYREHANYFLHGRTGDTPRKLHYLIDSTDEFDEEFKKLGKEGDKVVKGSVGHFLFMVAYERTFDELLEVSEYMIQLQTSQSTELSELKLRIQTLENKRFVTSSTRPGKNRRNSFSI